MTVLFKPLAVAEEMRRLAKSARAHLERNDDLRLRRAADDLEIWFQSGAPGPFDWTLDEPIETRQSRSYQGFGNAHAVLGRFTFSWRCERNNDPLLLSAANGASEVAIVRPNGNVVNEYHFDLCVGGAVPPSPVMHCFSHTQFSGGTSFPRFPSMLLLPTDVLEMLLFELWPVDWSQTAEDNRNNLLRHHRAQRARIGRMAKAFQQLATRRYPLVSLHARPPAPIHLY